MKIQNSKTAGDADCELRAGSKTGKFVPSVGWSVPTFGELLETGAADEKRFPLILQGLASVLNDGTSDASGDA